jgi:hypothetical protein
VAETPEEHINTVDAGLYHVFEVTKAACETVASTRNMLPSGIDPAKWEALVNAVTSYRGLIDPEAAKRNRDEHGPDIPTKNLDWRDKL